ncbi:hypothetical protein KFK09_007083 [Dendrobium nobile]|uniref:SLL1 protein n=1 Tax=Dendrobium nobile TaxID=94219 RepID=A0A8T3BTC5_DENNO|nr:hypothetical protein KFK09_007083 [Dendrobium nobile]
MLPSLRASSRSCLRSKCRSFRSEREGGRRVRAGRQEELGRMGSVGFGQSSGRRSAASEGSAPPSKSMFATHTWKVMGSFNLEAMKVGYYGEDFSHLQVLNVRIYATHLDILLYLHHFLLFNVFRGLHATGVKKMGAHGHDEPFYVHAKHMYNLDRMKHQKVKMSLGVLAAFSIGVGVPVYAVIFQQRKTASG